MATSSGPTCKCVEGFVGNPFPGGACFPDVCSVTEPCHEPSICVGGRCKERCEGVVCGVGATCNPLTNKCVCNSFFTGNPDLLCMPRKYSSKEMISMTVAVGMISPVPLGGEALLLSII